MIPTRTPAPFTLIELSQLHDEFLAMVDETNAQLLEVLSQSTVRGGILGKTRCAIQKVSRP